MHLLAAPLPRYRLYTSLASYGQAAADIVNGRWATGEDVSHLEAEICRRQGAASALLTPMARVGIYLAIRALVRPGHKVILSPYTLADVVNMVLCAGGIPVFADIERQTCNIDPASIEPLLDERTDAVLVTHLHGLACDMDRIAALCRRHGLRLIEDCAQAFGTRFAGQPVGTFGDAGIYSFGMYKNVNAFYGGAVVARDRGVREAMREIMREWPRQELASLSKRIGFGALTDLATTPIVFKSVTYWTFRFGFLKGIHLLNRQVLVDTDPQIKTALPEGYARRPTPLQARLILRQLDDVDRFTEARTAAARLYDEGLRGLPGVVQPPLREDGSHIYTHYPLQVPDRAALLRHMVQNGRDVAIQHLRNCAELPCFSAYARDCPNAEATTRSNILLATYPRYALSEVKRTIATIQEFFGAV